MIRHLLLALRVPCLTSPPPHKKRKFNVDEVTLDTLKSIQDRRLDKKPTDLDEDYHFSMQMYSTLKNLDTRKKAMAKLHIHQYLTSVTLDLDDTSLFSQAISEQN